MSLPKICLVMNVHQEQEIILQCLESVAPYISCACITFNDKKDTTRDIMMQFFEQREIPMAWQYKEYENGASQRSYTIESAIIENNNVYRWNEFKDIGPADYFLYIDADNTLEVFGVAPVEHSAQVFADLHLEAYSIKKECDGYEYSGVVQLLRADLPWKFESIIHEYPCLRTGEPFTCAELPGCIVHENNAQRKRDLYTHYMGHALILERELLENKNIPEHLLTRYWYYLGNSYFDAGMKSRAVECYIKRTTMGGFDQEIYYSFMRLGDLLQDVNKYWDAWNYRPQYLPAALQLMEHFRAQGLLNVARIIGVNTAAQQPNNYAMPAPPDLNARFITLLAELNKQ